MPHNPIMKASIVVIHTLQCERLQVGQAVAQLILERAERLRMTHSPNEPIVHLHSVVVFENHGDMLDWRGPWNEGKDGGGSAECAEAGVIHEIMSEVLRVVPAQDEFDCVEVCTSRNVYLVDYCFDLNA